MNGIRPNGSVIVDPGDDSRASRVLIIINNSVKLFSIPSGRDDRLILFAIFRK